MEGVIDAEEGPEDEQVERELTYEVGGDCRSNPQRAAAMWTVVGETACEQKHAPLLVYLPDTRLGMQTPCAHLRA